MVSLIRCWFQAWLRWQVCVARIILSTCDTKSQKCQRFGRSFTVQFIDEVSQTTGILSFRAAASIAWCWSSRNFVRRDACECEQPLDALVDLLLV